MVSSGCQIGFILGFVAGFRALRLAEGGGPAVSEDKAQPSAWEKNNNENNETDPQGSTGSRFCRLGRDRP
jgi:hypothetical protein